MLEKLQGNNQEKSIETPKLTIKGNIITWEGTMIQLSNISYVSVHPMAIVKFPILSIVLILIGILGIQVNVFAAIVMILIGAVWIYFWCNKAEEQKYKRYLNLELNSGSILSILFNNKEFLNEVLVVLEQIICDGGVENSNVYIDIKGNTFSGNAQVLDNLKINTTE